jgi:hypothetical protein
VTCARCHELAVEIEIRAPSELRSAISVVRDNLADNTIREITTGSRTGQRAFADETSGTNFHDVLNYQFECCSCAQRFSLTAETYHGSGGKWQPC